MNLESDSPIMFLGSHLGYDEDEGMGISGMDFVRELMFLDTLNKSQIDIWINSPGGLVSEADPIVSAILKSKTKVNTHNIGMAASSAGPIFLAGRKRYMMPHAKFMMHPVSGGNPKDRKAFEDSTVICLSNRIPVAEGEIRRMMNETTWLSATECKDLGMCEIDDSASLNKPRKVFNPENFIESYKDFKSIANKLIEEKTTKKTITMNKVTNKLKLVDGSNEDAILASIGEIENRAVTAESKLQTQEVENKAKIDALNKQISELTEVKNKFEADSKLAKEKEEAEAKAANEKASKEAVSNFVKLGKLKNDAKVIEAAEKHALTDLEGFKTLMEAMPVNKTAPSPIINKAEGGEAIPYTAAGIMAKIAIKNKQA